MTSDCHDIRPFVSISIQEALWERMSRIHGVVADYLASQTREPHQHQKDSLHVRRYLRIDIVSTVAAICAAGCISCLVISKPMCS